MVREKSVKSQGVLLSIVCGNPVITLCLDHVISEPCYKWTILMHLLL